MDVKTKRILRLEATGANRRLEVDFEDETPLRELLSNAIPEGGIGFIVRDNVIHTIFNGIGTGSFDDDQNPDIAHSADVYRNRMRDRHADHGAFLPPHMRA